METLKTFLATPEALPFLRSLMIVLGLAAVALGLHARLRNRHADRWPAVKGTVIHSQLESSADNQYRLSVAFRYRVKNRAIDSRPLTLTLPAAPAAANRMLKRLANGSKTVIHYDPARPENISVLSTSPGNWMEAVAAGLGLLLFALLAF